MQITDLKVLRMSTPTQSGTNWLFVKVETYSGIHGIGEASLQYKDAALMAELEDFKLMII